jgi:hypothetical protein
LLGRIEWAAVGKRIGSRQAPITPQIAMKPAILCFVFDPGFVRFRHQGGGAPDIDLGYHAANIAGLRSTKI